MPVFRKGRTNILFVHVPKNGGSTIERVFKDSGYRTLYLDGKVGRDSVNYVRHCTPQHMHAEVLRAVFKLQNFDAIFMTVRDPLSRFKSEYLWRKRADVGRVDEEAVDEWGEDAFTRYRDNPYLFDNHLRPQVEFLLPECEVYRLENGLAAVVEDLNRRFELALEPVEARQRVSKDVTGFSSSDVCVSPAMEQKVKDFYREDYLQFDYPL